MSSKCFCNSNQLFFYYLHSCLWSYITRTNASTSTCYYKINLKFIAKSIKIGLNEICIIGYHLVLHNLKSILNKSVNYKLTRSIYSLSSGNRIANDQYGRSMFFIKSLIEIFDTPTLI